MQDHYDFLIIGAGMSGLAAAIRLAMFDKKVCLVEKHTIAGGLNSFYRRKGRNFDVGLHAMTNFSQKGNRTSPLGKMLKQLRIPYDELKLNQQQSSLIDFPHHQLAFNNDFELLKSEIAQKFPDEIDNFNRLDQHINQFNEVGINNRFTLSKEIIRSFIKNETLIEMILAPLLIYGSAWENDMEFSQFAIMYKSIYQQGFMRPNGGVRPLIKLLLNKYKKLGGDIFFKSEVASFATLNNEIKSIKFKCGKTITAKKIISSIGIVETENLLPQKNILKHSPLVKGNLSFSECIFYLDKKPADMGIKHTIIFENKNEKYHYQKPHEPIDTNSSVICLPNNFADDEFDEGIVRLTNLANFDQWNTMDQQKYAATKEVIIQCSMQKMQQLFKHAPFKILAQDCFTPMTIQRYTGHLGGCVYGHQSKSKTGQTSYSNLFICGTDQGFLGIVGSILSGVSIANLWGLSA